MPGRLLSDLCIKDSYLESVENVDTGVVMGLGKPPLVSELGEVGEKYGYLAAGHQERVKRKM